MLRGPLFLVTLPVAEPSGYLEWVTSVRTAQRTLILGSDEAAREPPGGWDPLTDDLLDQLASQAYRASAVDLRRIAPVIRLRPCRRSIRGAMRHLEWIEREAERRGAPISPLAVELRWLSVLFIRRGARRAVFSRALHWLQAHAPGRSCPASIPAWELDRSRTPGSRVSSGASA